MSFRKYLVINGIISEKELVRASARLTRETRNPAYIRRTLGEILCDEHVLTEERLCAIYHEIAGCEILSTEHLETDRSAVDLLKGEDCRKGAFFPVKLSGEYLTVAMKDPMDLMTIQRIRQETDRHIRVCTACPSAIDALILKEYGGKVADRALEEMRSDLPQAAPSPEQEGEQEDAALSGTVRYVDSVITLALARGASDIHIEPGETESVTRIRVDGLLTDIKKTDISLHPAIVSRIKVMGNMDVAEKRVPQDGRAVFKGNAATADLRISSLPTVYGEKIVIRLLTKDASLTGKSSLGLNKENMKKYDTLLKNSSGLILITGPTGSGKSTTMLTMEKLLNRREVNIVTLEDPVEYHLPGISQVQINEKTGMTFARGLRAVMRQDPDIICVGEIRDEETAEIAMRAAITGHLVISTLHTGSAITAFERLRDMGVPDYLIASSVVGVIGQRLVRRICPNCRRAYRTEDCEREILQRAGAGTADGMLYRGAGCPACNNQGYKGRVGVFEVLVAGRQLRRAVARGEDSEGLEALALKEGYRSLQSDCLDKALEGLTTADELDRIMSTVD